MEIRFQIKNTWRCDAILFFVFENEKIEEIEERHKELFKCASWLSISPAWRDFQGKANELLLLYGHKDNKISRAYAVALGKSEKLSVELLRETVAKTIKACKALKLEHIALDIPSLKLALEKMTENKKELAYYVEEVCTAALSSLYEYTEYKTAEQDTFAPISLSLCLEETEVPNEIQSAARLAEANYSALSLARNLSNMPANALTPAIFAEQAGAVARKHGFKCTILEKRHLEELGMNSFLAVAKGSSQEPRLIILEYTPKNCQYKEPYAFVGKGLTFDSGGISLKPSKGMEEMKTDMSGAADVLALFEALGQAKIAYEPNRPIIGLLGCAENMPDGNAVKPGDVVRTYDGKTVEITNTDAEGRLVLIDVLAYAQKMYNPEIVIDIATLTGACVVALGEESAGLFANEDKLASALLDSSACVGERIWRLPLWEHMLKKIESPIADLDNAGPRDGGALTAAVFIQQFIKENQTWAHLDIAGPNFKSSSSALCPKGATGFGTRILFDFVRKN